MRVGTSITTEGIDVIYMDMQVFVCVLGCSVRQERKGEETHLNLVKKAGRGRDGVGDES